MAFKPSLVALPEDSGSAVTKLGFPLTEIVLEQPNGEGAAIPFVPNPDARDKITESASGSDVRVIRRKVTEVEIDIDYISSEKKAEIERLYHDARSVYLAPNRGVDTVMSFPLQRSVEDWCEFKTMAGNHNYIEYHWDETDKVFRQWAADYPVLPIHGHWSRYFTSTYGMDNEAAKPHPDSSSTGWVTHTGTVTISYEEEILSPVLGKRTVTNGKGVTIVEAGSPQSPVAKVQHTSQPALSTSYDIGASVCICAFGAFELVLETTAGAAIHSYHVTGDGTFHLYKLRGTNPGVNQARIRIDLEDTDTRDQTIIIGPVFIGSEGSAVNAARVPDWSDGSTDTSEAISSDANKWIMPEVTASFFFRYRPDNYLGFIEVDTSSGFYLSMSPADRFLVSQDSVITNFYNISTSFPTISDGDWVHCVVTGGNDGLCLYINGVAHSSNGTGDYNPAKRNQTMRLGRIGSYPLIDSGMSHMRIDRRQWSQAEVTDHYDTYFSIAGRGAIEPTFCKEMIIEQMDWDYRVPDQWVGKITLRELGPDVNFATMQRQEDM